MRITYKIQMQQQRFYTLRVRNAMEMRVYIDRLATSSQHRQNRITVERRVNTWQKTGTGQQ